jgi:hypothetical protein
MSNRLDGIAAAIRADIAAAGRGDLRLMELEYPEPSTGGRGRTQMGDGARWLPQSSRTGGPVGRGLEQKTAWSQPLHAAALPATV